MVGRIVDLEVKDFEPGGEAVGLLDLFQPLCRVPYAMLLLSGGDLDCSRYSIMGWDPFLVLEAKGRRMFLWAGPESRHYLADPFQVLEDILGGLELPGSSPMAPFSAGGLGFFAYELKNHLECLPQSAVDDLGLPELVLAFPRELVVQDRQENRYWRLHVVYEDGSGRCQPGTVPDLPRTAAPLGGYEVGALRSNFARGAYLEAVRRIREYIRQGDIYQVNLSQRFSFPFQGEAYRLFRRLFGLNPAPFYAFLNCGKFRVLSTSMERFLYRQGDYLETRPIKGTRPRGRTPEEDEALRRELTASLKDDAELSMIVDLLRNDLGKVCRARTVQVKEHKRLEAYQNVYHLVSIVAGTLKPGCSHVDILRATYPGGSITGCPKIRSMEIIDELEPQVRHVYTGAIGYLGCHRNLDLSVGIRTAIFARGWGHFAVGGGVVYDSNEEEEYDETLHKGQTLFRVIEGEKEVLRRGPGDRRPPALPSNSPPHPL